MRGPGEDKGNWGTKEDRAKGELTGGKGNWGTEGFDRVFRKRRSNTEKYTTFKNVFKIITKN